MKTFLPQIMNFFSHRTKVLSWVLALMLMSTTVLTLQSFGAESGEGIFSLIDQASAFDTSGTVNPSVSTSGGDGGAFDDLFQAGGGIVAGLATLIIKLLGGLVWFVLYWMGDLMDSTFILEGEIGVKLHLVWTIIRNYVNIFFALALVVVAFLAVIGYGDESGNYALKKFIPKMALALIAVNFTFTACKVVLDVNDVLTTAIFSIPQNITNFSDVAGGTSEGTQVFKKMKCFTNEKTSETLKRIKAMQKHYPNVINSMGGVCIAGYPLDVINSKSIPESDIIPLNASTFGKKDFVWAMATQFQGLHNLNKVSQLTEKSFTTLTVNALFSIVFAIIYGTAYIAMFIILVARIAVLWITIMLSPLAAVAIIFPDILPEQLSVKNFIDHAFVPTKMAIPISLGYIMISQMSLAIDTSSPVIQDKLLDLSDGGEFARGTSITSLMYGAASVAVLWTGVFTASKDVVGHAWVEQMSDFVKNAGKTASKWPTYIPLVPTQHGMASFSNLKYASEEVRNALKEAQLRKDERFAAKFIPTSEIRRAMQRVTDQVEKGKLERDALEKDMKTIATTGSVKDLQHALTEVDNKFGTDARFRDVYSQFAKNSGFDSTAELQEKIKLGKWDEIKQTIEESKGSSGPTQSVAPDYSEAMMAFGGKGHKWKLDWDDFKAEEKPKANLSTEKPADGKLTEIEMGVSQTKPGEFLDMLAGKSAEKRGEILSKYGAHNLGVLEQMAADKGMREIMKGHTKLEEKVLLRSFVRGNTDYNNRLLKLYMELYGEDQKKDLAEFMKETNEKYGMEAGSSLFS